MAGLASYIAGGLTVALVMDGLGFAGIGANLFSFANSNSDVVVSMNSVDRSQKGNRLTPNGVGNDRNLTIAVVEVVGLRDAAIVYRDRNGGRFVPQ